MSSEVIHTLLALITAFSILAVLMVASLIQIVLKGRKYRMINGLVIITAAAGFILSLVMLVFPATGNSVELGNMSPSVDMSETLNNDH